MSKFFIQVYSKSFSHWFISTRHCSQNILQGPKKKTKTKQQRLHYNHDVIEYLQKLSNERKRNEKDILSHTREHFMHSILTNPSQIVGFNFLEMKKRVELFLSVGISVNDAIILSLNIPSCLNVVNDNFKNVLQEIQSSGLSMEKIIFEYPYIGSISYSIVHDNLQLLKDEFGFFEQPPLESEETSVFTLIHEHPMLLSYPLNKQSIELLKATTFNLQGDAMILDNIKLSMKEAAVSRKSIDELSSSYKVVEAINTLPAIEFLTSYSIDLNSIAVTCPEFFLATQEDIDTCVTQVSSEPFFFAAEDIEILLSSYPDVFLSFSKEIVQKQAEFIAKVSTTKTRAYKLLSEYPELFRDPDKFFQRVSIFESYDIKNGDVGRLLAQKGGTNCFIDSEDFTDKSLQNILDFYSSEKDLTPLQIIVAAPISLSRKSTNIIKARLSFMRNKQLVSSMTRKKKKNRSQITLQSIVRASLKEFVETICSSNMEEFEIFCKEKRLKNYKAEYKKS